MRCDWHCHHEAFGRRIALLEGALHRNDLHGVSRRKEASDGTKDLISLRGHLALQAFRHGIIGKGMFVLNFQTETLQPVQETLALQILHLADVYCVRVYAFSNVRL